MRQKIKNTVHISVDGIDLTTLANIEFYVRQAGKFFQYTPYVIDASNMIITIPKEDADELWAATVKLQFAFTDKDGNDDASEVVSVPIEELLKGDGYAY